MIEQRILELAPRIRAMARIYANSTLETEDDLFQDVVLHLLERQAKDPEFSAQNDSYILDAGRKRICWPKMRRKRVHDKYITGEPKAEDDNLDGWLDSVSGNEINPEEAVVNLEGAAAIAENLRKLSRREREVLSLVVSGVRTGEIAVRFGCSPAAISVYKRRAANKISAAKV